MTILKTKYFCEIKTLQWLTNSVLKYINAKKKKAN